MEHRLVITENTKEGVKSVLFGFASSDNDFNGKNGSEYLWKEAADNGFSSNADYVWSKASEKNSLKDVVETFVSLWMMSDSYYEDFSVEAEEFNDYIAISLAYTISK
jgi:hypothetical protein